MAYYCVKRSRNEKVQCPYDKSHLISKYLMEDHVEQCRVKWVQDAVKNRVKMNVFVCQHNLDHRIFAPELKWHESQCPDRGKVRSYQVNVTQTLKDAGQWPPGKKAMVVKPDAKEIRRWMHPCLIFGAQNFGQPIRMDEIAKLREEEKQRASKQRTQIHEDFMRKSSMSPELYEQWKQVNETEKRLDNMGIGNDPPPQWQRLPFNLTEKQKKEYLKTLYLRHYYFRK